ncbi:hypothetical protein [Clostridium putrefaciens]|uniref:hypothetical protein n=1 Tax=Clostridium putrefaciens TaxID=99675 RepID=UPI000E20B593|nr:hypothetical protein [Clostridium putrefaciens]
MTRSIKDSFLGFSSELLESIRENANSKLDEAHLKKKILGLKRQLRLYVKQKLKTRKSFIYCKNIGTYSVVKQMNFCNK